MDAHISNTIVSARTEEEFSSKTQISTLHVFACNDFMILEKNIWNYVYLKVSLKFDILHSSLHAIRFIFFYSLDLFE